ncbi:MAG: O-antigen ligase family protein [bacterium]|nr:O-antigen ligase family protein [bacterium]
MSRTRFSLNLLDKVQLSLLGAIFLSSTFAVYKVHSFIAGSLFISYLISYFLSKTLLKNENDFNKLTDFLSYCACAISIIGIFQYFTKLSFVIKGIPIIAPMQGGRINSICYNTLILSSFLAFTIPIFISFFIKGYKRIFLVTTIILSLVSFFLTLSRGPAISLIISIIFLFCLLNKKVAAIILPIILIVICFIFTPLKTRFLDTSYLSGDIKRKVTVIPGIRMWKEHSILTGVGIHNFYLLYENYALPSYCYKGPHYIHCMYLNFLVESGIIGFLVLMLIFIILTRWGWQIYKRNIDFKRWISAALLASFLNVLIHNIADNTPYVIGLGILFWAGMGIISGMKDSMEKC